MFKSPWLMTLLTLIACAVAYVVLIAYHEVLLIFLAVFAIWVIYTWWSLWID